MRSLRHSIGDAVITAQAFQHDSDLVLSREVPTGLTPDLLVLIDGVRLAENIERAPLHPVDQFRAFQAMREKGMTEEAIAAAFFVDAKVGLYCTNPVRDSSCESSVMAGGHEHAGRTDLQDAERARVKQGPQAPRVAVDLVRS